MSQSRKELLNNRLDEDIKRIAYSLNLPLNLFLTSKYYLRKSLIYTSGHKYHVFAFCLMLFLNTLCVVRIFMVEDIEVNKTQFKYDNIFSLSTIIYFIACSIGFTLIFILDFVHKENNVLLVLKIQTIHRCIDFSKSIRSFIIWNWSANTTTIIIHILINVMYFNPFISVGTGFIISEICDIMCIPLDLNFVIAIRIIILLKKYLDKWINDVMMMNYENNNDDQCLKLFGIYENILITYNLYNEIFQVLVLYHTFSVFQRGLCYVTYVIYVMKNSAELGNDALLRSVGLISFLTKDIVLVILHCIYCEKFYITVEEAMMVCIQLMKKRDYPKCQELLYKNVLQINRTFSKMTACGLFYVDATLPICLMEVIVHYAVIELQFYFL